MIKKLAVFPYLLVILTSCSRPATSKPAYIPPASQYDIALENFGYTTNQLDAVGKEKDLFIKSLDDFEQQQSDYARLWDTNQIFSQMQRFADWHKDIAIRERNLEIRHALNILAAHQQVMKHKLTDPNQPLPAHYGTDFSR